MQAADRAVPEADVGQRPKRSVLELGGVLPCGVAPEQEALPGEGIHGARHERHEIIRSAPDQFFLGHSQESGRDLVGRDEHTPVVEQEHTHAGRIHVRRC